MKTVRRIQQPWYHRVHHTKSSLSLTKVHGVKQLGFSFIIMLSPPHALSRLELIKLCWFIKGICKSEPLCLSSYKTSYSKALIL